MKTLKSIKIFAISIALFLNSFAIATANDYTDFILPAYSQKVSMDFQDASLVDVLKIFSQQTNMNFIASDSLGTKKITLYFDNVPIEDALKQILQANNLTYALDPISNVFLISPKKTKKEKVLTRIYRLKHATVPSAKLNQTISIDSSNSSRSSRASSSGIYAVVQSVLSKSGSLIEDPRTNSLIITDFEIQFPIIEAAIAKLDVPISQILIEVEMLDISKNTADLIGNKFGTTPLAWTGAQKNHLWPFIDTQDFSFEDGKYTVGTVDASGLSFILQFLKTQTDTKNLARPRLLTMNNETAQIKISTDEAIGIKTNTQSSEGLATETVEPERVETGVFLTVTPQANLTTGVITLAISPKVIQATDGLSFNGQTFKDPEERGSDSILKVQNGETVVLGGLLRSEDSNIETKVPILGDIPFFGKAFRHQNKTSRERELMIFITPKIIDDPAVILHNTSNSSTYLQSSREQAIERELQLINIEKQIF